MKFEEWFEQQFGPPPSGRNPNYARIRARILDGEKARLELRKIEEYEASRTDALYGWNARKAQAMEDYADFMESE